MSDFKNIKYAEDYLSIASDLNINIAFCGAHGRAKTSFVKQYADKNGYELITIILSRMTPEDMIGLPTSDKYKDNMVTCFSSPDWLVKASDPDNKVLLFFDEFNNSEPDTMASILDLIESREANGLHLNDNTQIVMAFNPPSIAPNGHVLSKATRDRICVIPIADTNSNASYIKYYRDNGMAALADTLIAMDNVVPRYDDEVVESSYENAEPTYRSLDKSYQIMKYCYDHDLKYGIAETMVCGFVGGIGTSLSKNLLDNIKIQASGESLIDKMKKSYNEGGVDELIKYILENNIFGNNDFASAMSTANAISEVVPNSMELNKVLKACTTKEFREAYYSKHPIK